MGSYQSVNILRWCSPRCWPWSPLRPASSGPTRRRWAAPLYGHGVVSAPVVSAPVVSAPVVSAPYVSAPYVKAALPVATSYANTVKIASPIAVAAPASYVAAPAAVHAPLYASPLAHAW
ncbi:hypothetical protein EVAR_28318_1 [Eumeta japonica]|uniref:Uncharacterized protein n=1 Tax=Eumeta variegata TaxID=151549 RepID=A0A4C1V8U6_EUMVA|nr:hypothetical protein EVAR_28318_1 [Eumeta japonica]